MAIIDFWSYKESKSIADEGVAKVNDPLEEEINKKSADQIKKKYVAETYLAR